VDYVAKANGYAQSVLDGSVVACEYVKLAADRHLKDLKRWQAKTSPYRFDADEANRVCAFVECLPHVKGEWARQGGTITLEPWQCLILAVTMGWKRRSDGLRRFRTVYTEVARKNAKSTLAAGVALYCMELDGEPGAEVYSAATTRDQAKIVWETAHSMVKKNGDLRSIGLNVHAHSITGADGGSFKALSADAGTLDGLNVHCAIIDELHAHKTREVWEVIETGTGARAQPLVWVVTTAGSNRAGICYEQRDYAIKVLKGVVEDDTYFGIVYTIDEGDDWTDEAVWAKANPNLGVSVKLDDLQRKAAKARTQTSAQPGFLTKHLNQWVNADQAWMDMRRWDACGDPTLDIADFRGEACWIGADLASKTDIAAVGVLFERNRKKYLFRFCWAPGEAVEGSRNSQYPGWRTEGRLIVTDGATIDFREIEDKIRELAREYQLRVAGFDEWQAVRTMQELQAEGLPVLKFPQTAAYLSEPMKTLEADVLAGNVVHQGCPMAAWQVSNVVAHLDHRDQVSPRKEMEQNKIDLPVAWMTAYGVYLREQSPEGAIDVSKLVFA
jgi:phage terminase large subunit-like protein